MEIQGLKEQITVQDQVRDQLNTEMSQMMSEFKQLNSRLPAFQQKANTLEVEVNIKTVLIDSLIEREKCTTNKLRAMRAILKSQRLYDYFQEALARKEQISVCKDL